jgi:glycosyltransferase involved in cell wall biosynthesis
MTDAAARDAKLTIAHVMGYYAPGLGYQENFLPFEQAALGHDVHIVTGDRYMPHPSYETVYAPRLGPRIVGAGTSAERGVTVHRLAVPFEAERRANPWLSGSPALLARLAPDVVHLHGVTPLSSVAVILSAVARRCALVCDHHLCRFNMAPFHRVKRIYYALARALYVPLARRRVRAWLPINEDAAGVLADVLGIGDGGVHINRLGVDTARFRRDSALGQAWRQAHGIAPDAPLIVHAGRLENRKGLDRLIAAFARAFPAGSSDAVLALVGDGEAAVQAALRAQADALEISDRVRFPGMLRHEDLPALFNAADAGAWPGDPSITLIEGLGCGLPMIISDPPGLAYVAGCPGVETVQGDGIDPLAAALSRQSGRSADEREAIAAACAARLGWPAIAAESVAIYRAAIAAGA